MREYFPLKFSEHSMLACRLAHHDADNAHGMDCVPAAVRTLLQAFLSHWFDKLGYVPYSDEYQTPIKTHGTNHFDELIWLKYDCQYDCRTLTRCTELSNREGDGTPPSSLVSAP